MARVYRMFPEHSPSVDIQWMAMVDCTYILHLPRKQSLRPTAKVMETYSTNGLYLTFKTSRFVNSVDPDQTTLFGAV